MPKINVYVPDDLAEQVKTHDIPVSSVCQQALREEVARMQARAAVTDEIERVAARLRETQDEEIVRARQDGHDDGGRWAREAATYTDLVRIDSGGAQDVAYDGPEEHRTEYLAGFGKGAMEVWQAVRHLV